VSESANATVESIREQVSTACRYLALNGFGDLTLGHVSIRGDDPQVAHIKGKGHALSEVVPDDVLPLNIDDLEALRGPGMHLEAVLHTEVYRARPDVGAVIHAHPWYSTALAGTHGDLQVLTHDSVLFKAGLPVFDETSEMIVEPEQGKAVAEVLGGARALLLRNHGVLVVGEDIKWTVLAAVTLERAARMQHIASGLGPPAAIPDQAVPDVYRTKYQGQFLDEYWAHWCRVVELAEQSGRLPRA